MPCLMPECGAHVVLGLLGVDDHVAADAVGQARHDKALRRGVWIGGNLFLEHNVRARDPPCDWAAVEGEHTRYFYCHSIRWPLW